MTVSREATRARAEWSRADYANAPERDALFTYSLRMLEARDALREARDAAYRAERVKVAR